MKLSIKYKILIIFTVTMLVATTLNLLFISRVLKDNYTEALKSELFTQANYLKSQLTRITDLGISVKDIEGFDRICLDLARKNTSLLDAMVVDSEGTILYHNNTMFHGLKIKPVEIVQLLRQKQPTLMCFRDRDNDIYRAVVPYYDDNGYARYGIIVSCSADIINAKSMSLISRCNIFFLSTFGLAALLLLISLSWILTGPLEKILYTIKSISDSKILDQHIDVKTEDEIGQLAAAFNKMADDLHHSTISIDHLNEEINIRKAAENQAQSARHEAEMANLMKNAFLAEMSHEIRTPMNALLGFTEILRDEYLTENQKKYTNIIYDNAQALLNLINDILDFSKLEVGRLQLEKTLCRSMDIVENIELSLSPIASSKGIDFKVILSQNFPKQIYTDPTRLRQCLGTLIGSAIKNTNRGHVYLRMLINFSDDQQPKLYFVIEDTGPVIPKEKLEQLFNTSCLSNTGDPRQFGGTRLAFIITKKLVELMGGQIYVISDKNTGTVFTVTLPMETAPNAEKAKQTSTSV